MTSRGTWKHQTLWYELDFFFDIQGLRQMRHWHVHTCSRVLRSVAQCCYSRSRRQGQGEEGYTEGHVRGHSHSAAPEKQMQHDSGSQTRFDDKTRRTARSTPNTLLHRWVFHSRGGPTCRMVCRSGGGGRLLAKSIGGRLSWTTTTTQWEGATRSSNNAG